MVADDLGGDAEGFFDFGKMSVPSQSGNSVQEEKQISSALSSKWASHRLLVQAMPTPLETLRAYGQLAGTLAAVSVSISLGGRILHTRALRLRHSLHACALLVSAIV